MKKKFVIAVGILLVAALGAFFLFRGDGSSPQSNLSEQLYNKMVAEYQSAVKALYGMCDEEVAKKLIQAEESYFTEQIKSDIAYLNNTQPFYAPWRMEANLLLARGTFISIIVDRLSNNQVSESQLQKFCETGDIRKFDEATYFRAVNVAPNRINREYSSLSREQLGITASNHIFCSYSHMDDITELCGVAGDVLMAIPGALGMVGKALSAASFVSYQDFTCRYWGNLENYSLTYYYDGLLSKRREREPTVFISNDMKSDIDGIPFSSTTVISNLDYIEMAVAVDGQTESYVFKWNRGAKEWSSVDPVSFQENVAYQYAQ